MCIYTHILFITHIRYIGSKHIQYFLTISWRYKKDLRRKYLIELFFFQTMIHVFLGPSFQWQCSILSFLLCNSFKKCFLCAISLVADIASTRETWEKVLKMWLVRKLSQTKRDTERGEDQKVQQELRGPGDTSASICQSAAKERRK